MYERLMMIQSFCLAMQQSGEWEWNLETASWEWSFDGSMDAGVQITDEGFEFFLNDGTEELSRVKIDGVKHLKRLIRGC